MRTALGPIAVCTIVVMIAGCGRDDAAQQPAANAPAAGAQAVPERLPMGTGGRSVMSFFITSAGPGRGGDLGGLAGADAHCMALARAEGIEDRMYRAYLSTSATADTPAVNARDRIGNGPWYNADGYLVAADLDQLHGAMNRINKQTAFTEKFAAVNGAGDTPNRHDIVTGSRPDGTAFEAGENLTCGNWTSSDAGRAQVGHHDRMGQGPAAASWNSAHPSQGCSQQALEVTGGAGLFYCFAAD